MHGILKIEERLEEMKTVIDQTRNHKHFVLETAAKSMMKWKRQVYQIKSIFTIMNTFNYNLSHESFIAEIWCPEKEIVNIRRAIDEGSKAAGSLVPSFLQTFLDPDTSSAANYQTNQTENRTEQAQNDLSQSDQVDAQAEAKAREEKRENENAEMNKENEERKKEEEKRKKKLTKSQHFIERTK